MAQHIEIGLSNDPPCDSREAAGSYLCHLHLWGQRGLEHRFVQLGRHDPSAIPIGELSQVLLRITEDRRDRYRNKGAVPLSRLVGMSVLRACMHDFTLKDGITDTRLQGELAGTYAFVEDVDRFYPAAYSEEEPRLSLNGVSTHLKVTDADDSRFVLAQHLMATPNQERDFPVAYAVPSLAATRLHKDAWVALRPIPDETRFDVTLVSRDELLDTMELRV